MLTTLYQEYLYVIGKLKDVHGLTIDVEHKDIHTFLKDNKPLFKLFYGVFEKDSEPTIVVSFHIDLWHVQAINWFIHIYKIHPLLKLHDSYIEDANGETYLGDDAEALRQIYESQHILAEWLDTSSKKEIKQFVKADVVGRERHRAKLYYSEIQKDDAVAEFDRLRKPSDDEDVH